MTTAYKVSATLTNGSATVTAAAGAFTLNVYPGSTLIRGGVTAVVKTVDSATQLTLEEAWTGATATSDVWITRLSPQQYSFAEINRKYSLALEAMARGFTLTSATSLAIGTGSKVFTVEAGLPILAGARMMACSRANLDNCMSGTVTDYTDTALTIDVDAVGGSGTFADWNINLAGSKGITGDTGATGATGPAGADGADGEITRSGAQTGGLAKWASDTAISQATEITLSGGKVGIGTTSPGAVLELNSSAFSSTAGTNQILRIANGATPYFGLRLDATSQYLNLDRYWGGAWAATPALTVDRATGYVGIGTASPSTPLVVVGQNTIDGKANTTALFRVSNTTTVDAALGVGSTNGNRPFVAALDGTTAAASLDFYTGADLRVRIDASTGDFSIISGDLLLPSTGIVNFGAGDVTISHLSNILEFAGAESGYYFTGGQLLVNGQNAVIGYDGVTEGGVFIAKSSTYGDAAVQSVSSGFAAAPLLLNPIGGSVAVGTTSPAGSVPLTIIGNGTYSGVGGYGLAILGATTSGPSMIFGPGGTYDGRQWSFTATGSGNTSLGGAGRFCLVDRTATAVRMSFNSTGNIQLPAYGAGTLTTDASGNVTATSDIRLKTDIRPFARGLADLVKISPIIHKWSVASGLDRLNDYAGFSAQDVEAAIPEAVFENANGFKSLLERPIVAALVNSVKELAGLVDDLTARVAILEGAA